MLPTIELVLFQLLISMSKVSQVGSSLPLHNHKTIYHITEYQDDDTDECVADSLFCLIIFLFITCSCEHEKSSIHDHDDDDERDKAIEEYYNLCHCSQYSRCIEDTIGTVCRYAKNPIPTTIPSSVGYTDERLCYHHDHETYHRTDKYLFPIFKAFFISP